jgi:two-component system response regulator YesN
MEGAEDRSSLYQYQFIEYMRELSRFSAFNTLLYDFYIYFADTDTILTPSLKTNSSTFYHQIYTHSDMSYEEYKETILGQPHMKTFMPVTLLVNAQKQEQMIAYLQSLPFGEQNQIRGNLVIDRQATNPRDITGNRGTS